MQIRSHITALTLSLSTLVTAAGCASGPGEEQVGACERDVAGELSEQSCEAGDGSRAVVAGDFGNAVIEAQGCGQLLPGQQNALAQYINGLGLGPATAIQVVVKSCAPPPIPATVDVYLQIRGQLVRVSVSFAPGLFPIGAPMWNVPPPPGGMRPLAPMPQPAMGI